ncbi:hypothetical protein [Actinoplanes flavus]|uniref:Uncharacterized protein n=1 Tax=Actinoplanes flavus TaxID=2820290 RepID=A0ABS3UIV8_9ACTN|nr:hypothetical protein [Actinoplanes flavus]MBO3738720.1 hypothetical protein [Actinoplanes flavus]
MIQAIVPVAKAIWASPLGRKATVMAAGALISKVTNRHVGGVGGVGPNATDNQGVIVNR